MTQEDIEKAAGEYSGGILGFRYHSSMVEHIAFSDGAKWRIDSVWHKPNEEPIKLCDLLLIEQTDGKFELGYRFDAARTRRWAFVKDLIPNTENDK